MRFVLSLAVVAGLLLTIRCAHVEPPSGGPEDKTPPALLVSRPDSLAVVPDWDSPVVLVFDERVSEQEIEAAVRVSPATSDIVVDHGGDELRVSLREGWEPGTIYRITVLATVRDLFGNQMARPLDFVFSTGPEIPPTVVSGEVVDRITGKPVPTARIELIRQADSLVYAATPDSAGQFMIQHLPTGGYLVRAYDDRDLDLALGQFEPRDTSSVELEARDTARVALAIVEPDSTGPRLASATLVEDILELVFDDYLDPTPSIAPYVEVRGPGGERVSVAEARVGELDGAEPVEAGDTTKALLPSRSLSVRLAESADLEPGETYHVTVRSVVNVVGLSGEGEADFIAPLTRDTAQADTLHALH